MPDPQAKNDQPPASPERRVFVLVSIAVVALMFAGMVTLIYYRGMVKELTALIVVQGDDYFDGAVVIVDGPIPRTLSKTIGPDPKPDKNYICRFTVPPGTYTLRIEFKGKVIHEPPPMVITEGRIASLRLTRPADTQPAATKPAGY